MSYRTDNRLYPQLEGMMKLPNYQRPLVWSTEQKTKFISNISKGFPFGSLLLYQYENEGPYTLIDGQQRYTTLQEYGRNPERFYPLEDSRTIKKLMAATGADMQSEDAQAELRSKFISIARELIRLKASGSNPKNSFLADEIKKVFPPAGEDTSTAMEIVDIQGELINALNEYVNLETLEIPLVIFTGDKSDLPEVFANVNLGGRKLTKYQVFAAQWDRYSTTLANSELSNIVLDKTIDRYEKLTSDRGGLVIEDYSPEEMRNNRKVTLPELCHALGELIIEKTRACWPENSVDSDDTVDNIGYNTLAIAFGISPKELKDLPDKFSNAGFESDGEAVEKLLRDIKNEYEVINGVFAKFLKRPGNKIEYETIKTSGHLQFLSFFSALWVQHFGAVDSISYQPKPGYKYKGYDETCKNLFPSFIYDMLTNQWKGSGDSRLSNFVTGGLNYLIPTSKERLQTAASAYLTELNDSESINFDPIAKTLITVFANGHANDYGEGNYEYEHLIPRDTLNKKHNGNSAYKTFRIPGGGLGNIAYLDMSTNRGKGAKTLADSAGELHSFDGSREEVDGESLKAANLKLLNGDPEGAKTFMRQRATNIMGQVIDMICK